MRVKENEYKTGFLEPLNEEFEINVVEQDDRTVHPSELGFALENPDDQ